LPEIVSIAAFTLIGLTFQAEQSLQKETLIYDVNSIVDFTNTDLIGFCRIFRTSRVGSLPAVIQGDYHSAQSNQGFVASGPFIRHDAVFPV
jgi:hypothetical protein